MEALKSMDFARQLHFNAGPRQPLRYLQHLIASTCTSALIKGCLWRHSIKVTGREKLLDAVRNRPKYQPLITICNHHACLDDFILTGCVLDFKDMVNVERLRWTWAAVDICFTSPFYKFFVYGKGIPVWRNMTDPMTGERTSFGRGKYQDSVDFSIELLNNGNWLHLFPQGRIIQQFERDKEVQQRLRWGVGRVIAELDCDPVVLPIWQNGFDDLNPFDKPYLKYTTKRVLGPTQFLTVTVGDPIEMGSLKRDLMARLPPSSAAVKPTAQVKTEPQCREVVKAEPPRMEPIPYVHDAIYLRGENLQRLVEPKPMLIPEKPDVIQDETTKSAKPSNNPALDEVHSLLTAHVQKHLYDLKPRADQEHEQHRLSAKREH